MLDLKQLLPRCCCLSPPSSNSPQRQLPPALLAGQCPVGKSSQDILLLLPLAQAPQLAERSYVAARVAHTTAQQTWGVHNE
jgi:hypothetical protein